MEQQSWAEPDCKRWVAHLEGNIQAASGPVILVAHSLGCLAVAHWAVQANPDARIGAAFLVAPPWLDDKANVAPEVASFFPYPRRQLPFACAIAASRTDPYSTFAAAEQWSRTCRARLLDLGDAGHVNVDAGYGPWPAGESLLHHFLEQSGLPLAMAADATQSP